MLTTTQSRVANDFQLHAVVASIEHQWIIQNLPVRAQTVQSALFGLAEQNHQRWSAVPLVNAERTPACHLG